MTSFENRSFLAIAVAVAMAGAAHQAFAEEPAPTVAIEAGLPLGTAHAPEPQSALFSKTDPGASALGGAGTPVKTLALASAATPPVASVRVSADGARNGTPEEPARSGSHRPSGPLALLGGLLVVAVMAWRKVMPGAGASR